MIFSHMARGGLHKSPTEKSDICMHMHLCMHACMYVCEERTTLNSSCLKSNCKSYEKVTVGQPEGRAGTRIQLSWDEFRLHFTVDGAPLWWRQIQVIFFWNVKQRKQILVSMYSGSELGKKKNKQYHWNDAAVRVEIILYNHTPIFHIEFFLLKTKFLSHFYLHFYWEQLSLSLEPVLYEFNGMRSLVTNCCL